MLLLTLPRTRFAITEKLRILLQSLWFGEDRVTLMFLQNYSILQGSHRFLDLKFEEIWVDSRRNFNFLRSSRMKIWGDFLKFSRNSRRFSNLADNMQITRFLDNSQITRIIEGPPVTPWFMHSHTIFRRFTLHAKKIKFHVHAGWNLI